MREDTSSLVTRGKSFIKVANKHPRASNIVADVSEVGPKIRAHGVIGASIDTGTGSVGIPFLNGEGYGVLVVVKDS